MLLLLRLSVEELVEINDFYNAAIKVTITYVTEDLVLLELYDGGHIDEFILSKRDLIMVLRNFYVEDICDIVLSGIHNDIEVRVEESVEYYPVQITLADGHKYYCNLKELNYIRRLITNQKNRLQK